MSNANNHKKSVLASVSLLSASTGFLELTIIPSDKTPNWLLPSNLILDTLDINPDNAVINWRSHDVPVYSLTTQAAHGNAKAIVIEGTSDIYRIALLISDTMVERKCRIADVKDAQQAVEHPFIKHTVDLDGQVHVVPDVDALASRLVDLD